MKSPAPPSPICRLLTTDLENSDCATGANKTMQEWSADGQTADEAVAGAGGQDDWKVLKTAGVDFGEDDALARLGRKEI